MNWLTPPLLGRVARGGEPKEVFRNSTVSSGDSASSIFEEPLMSTNMTVRTWRLVAVGQTPLSASGSPRAGPLRVKLSSSEAIWAALLFNCAFANESPVADFVLDVRCIPLPGADFIQASSRLMRVQGPECGGPNGPPRGRPAHRCRRLELNDGRPYPGGRSTLPRQTARPDA